MIRRLVPGPGGLQEKQELNLSLGSPMLDYLAEMDPIAFKLLVALALISCPLEGQEFRELLRSGVIREGDRGKMAAVLTQVELGRLAGVDRRTAASRCRDLARQGWLTIHDIPRGGPGRFSGRRLYLLAAAEIVDVSAGAPESDWQKRQTIGLEPCTPDVHRSRRESAGDVLPCTADVQGGYNGCTGDGQQMYTMGASMEMETGNGKSGNDAFSATLSCNSCPDVGSEAAPIPGMLTVLDHFQRRVYERWPTATEQGQPLARMIAGRYGVAQALLSVPVAPAIVAQVPADLVEELWVLAQVLRDQGPVKVCAAIDRAMEREDKSPCRRLAAVWPRVPGATKFKRELGRNRREGERLPGGYREARKLFILVNHFQVGRPLLDRFLNLCRETGVSLVAQHLRQAIQEGREYVTLEFLRRSSRNQPRDFAAGPPPDGNCSPAGRGDPPPPPGEEARSTALSDAGFPGPGGNATEGAVQWALADALHALGGSFRCREQAPSLMRWLRQRGLSWETLFRCVEQARARALACRDEPRLGLFYQALREEVARAGGGID